MGDQLATADQDGQGEQATADAEKTDPTETSAASGADTKQAGSDDAPTPMNSQEVEKSRL